MDAASAASAPTKASYSSFTPQKDGNMSKPHDPSLRDRLAQSKQRKAALAALHREQTKRPLGDNPRMPSELVQVSTPETSETPKRSFWRRIFNR